MSRRLLRIGEAALQRPAQRVPHPVGGKMGRLIDRLVDTLFERSLISLSAPQIGIGLRLIALRMPDANGDSDATRTRRGALVLVNPVLTSLGCDTDVDFESCTSVPGARGTVRRHRSVRFDALDHAGRAVQGELHGLAARTLQHQCDHLDGILFPMRMGVDWSVEVKACLAKQDVATTTAQGWRVLGVRRAACH